MPEVNAGWDAADFLFAAALLLMVAVPCAAAVRKGASSTYRWGLAIALAGVLVLTWANAAVGFIGSEDNPANRMYLALPAVVFLGALLSRFRADGMDRTMLAAAGTQVLVAGIAIVAGLASAEARALLELAGLTAFFSAVWLASAWLFRKAALRAGG